MMRSCVLLGTSILTCLACAICIAGDSANPSIAVSGRTTTPSVEQRGQYVMLAWNDLGMHCLSPSFDQMAILPPYNTLWAVVIRKDEEPELVTSGITINYSMDWNKRRGVSKTNFWQYEDKLFGVNLQPGIGLTGNGFEGKMQVVGDHFEATGIPALPYSDDGRWNPYQRATLTLSGRRGRAQGTAQVVVPVSDEMNCAKCHTTGRSAARRIRTGSVEGNIIKLHDKREGTRLTANRPVLCASCHADPALGTAGRDNVPSMSLAMHSVHANLRRPPTCYDCHPGPKTQCNRSHIRQMGLDGNDPGCTRCHGDLKRFAQDLRGGRQPWLQEPTCAQCHGQQYSTGNVLFRNAKGHGGIYCAACHNSPHAWWPSLRADDNALPKALQGRSNPIGYKNCSVCHTDKRSGRRPPHDDDDGDDRDDD